MNKDLNKNILSKNSFNLTPGFFPKKIIVKNVNS